MVGYQTKLQIVKVYNLEIPTQKVRIVLDVSDPLLCMDFLENYTSIPRQLLLTELTDLHAYHVHSTNHLSSKKKRVW